VGQRAHTTLGGGVHPRVCASASNVMRTLPACPNVARGYSSPVHATRHARTWQTSVRNEDVNAEVGAQADYPYRSPTTVVVKAWANTPTTSTR